MIISPSHTLEYKPNDIIFTSSIGDALLHHPKYLASFPGSTSKDLGGGASVLMLTLAVLRFLPCRRHVMLSIDFHRVTVSRGALECAPLCRDRLGHAGSREEASIWKSTWRQAQDAYGLQRADIARVLPRGFILALRSHAENQRMADSTSLATRSNAVSHVAWLRET